MPDDEPTRPPTRRSPRPIQRSIDHAKTALARPLGAVGLVATVVCFYRLGHRPLWWWDESFYATAARNAIEHGHWLIPYTAGFDHLYAYPFLEKPPLAIWLQAVSIGAFGPTAFAVRVPSAVATIGVTVLAYVIARRIDGPAAGVAAATVFLTTPAVVLGPNGARFGATDMLHTLFGSVVVFLVWLRATDRYPSSPLVVGVVLSALLLTKGFAGGIFLVVVAPLLVLRYGRFGRRFLAIVGITTAVLVGWWVAAAYLLQGQHFVQEIFVEQVWHRLTGQMATVDYKTAVPLLKYPYATVVQVWFWPWWFLFLTGVAVTTGRCWYGRTATASIESIDTAFPVWWAAATFVPFALTGTAPWYVIPMYLPAAILIGRLVTDAADGRPASILGLLAGTVLVVAAGTDRLLYSPGASDGIAFDPGPVLAWTAALAVGALLVGVWLLRTDRLGQAAAIVERDRSPDFRRYLRLGVTGMTLTLVVVGLVGAPSAHANGTTAAPHHFDERTEKIDAAMRDIGERTNRVVPEGRRIYVQPNAEANWFYSSYAFYANRPLREGPVEQLRSDPRITYALVTTDGQSLVDDRRPEVLATSPRLDLVLVKLGPPNED